ncbi:uncharacterized protein BXIN_1908 [Babesia sp. Xinjiang]|uniref:uncharacterized protein n=1 Tax=Babesia sp. Xinjiang TaxID=462227 RepID=UPI000A2656DC|nr:uncharacterized protein BXIN_1908 [Babesia sp. Xinjiang]ORM40613.1 hypothetical protein BXIN_1908 [Babesia sp. Xinjiang]
MNHVTCSSQSGLAGVISWSKFPALSLEDVSTFLNRYEAGVECLRTRRCEISVSNLLTKATFWAPHSFASSAGSDVPVAHATTPLYLEAFCLLLSLCVLVICHLGLCYILWLRYVKLLRHTLSVLWQALRHVDWHSPLHAIEAVYTSLRYVVTTGIYIWSTLSHRDRYIAICVTGFITCVLSIRLGFGRRRFWRSLPLIATWILYYCFRAQLNPVAQHYLVLYGGVYLPHLWTLWMLCHYRVVCSPTPRLVDRSGNSKQVVREMNCLLDLFLVFWLLQICGTVPLLGSFFVRQHYLHNVMFFVSVLAVVHCALARWLAKDQLSSSLGAVKSVIIVTIDTIVNFAVGWPNIVSSRISHLSRKNGFPGVVFRRIGTMISIVLPSASERFSQLRGLGTALRWLRLAPYFVVLLLPRAVLGLYFFYLTLVSPLICCLLLPRGSGFKSQTVVALHFIFADAVRSVVFLTAGSLLPLRGLACLVLPALMDVVQHYMDDVQSEPDSKRSD